MRTIVAVFLMAALFAAPVPALAAPQDITVTFDVPTTGGAPTGYRLFKDGTQVGAVIPGQKFTAALPGDGSYVLGVEAFNATGAGARVNRTITVGPLVPGPVGNLVITIACATTTPATCTVTNVAGP